MPRTGHSKVLLWLILHIFLGFILICQNIFFCCFRFKQMYLCFLVVKEIGFRQSFLYVFSVFVPVAWPTYSNICYSAYNIVNLVTLHRFCFFGGELKHQTHAWVKFMHCHSCLLTCDYMHSHKKMGSHNIQIGKHKSNWNKSKHTEKI